VIGVLGFLVIVGVAAGLGRLFMGLAASTGLTDAYPWGIWIGFDFTLIALSGVGFVMAATVHVFHQHQFHDVLRPAILAGLMGYVAVLLLLVLDLGRPDRFYHFLLYFNLHSPLFEISWCVLLYSSVLMLEVAPTLFERLRWRRLMKWVLWIMTPVTILGVTLSTLHQSTLGTLYLNITERLHPLWYTPWLPVLFYTSSILAGLAVGILVYRLAMRAEGLPEKQSVILGLGKGMVGAALLYGGLKLVELVWSGDLPLLWTSGWGPLFLAELIVGVVLPVVLWVIPSLRRRSWVQWTAPLLVVFGIGMNRFDATLYGQYAPADAVYSPHVLEWLSTIGILAAAALAWYLGVRFVLAPLAHKKTA
jgi:Ni/Fe-hydrogenase subunit HybB-like protein